MKEIKKMYKLMHKNEITTQEWWDFIEGLDKGEVMEVIQYMSQVKDRLRSFENGDYFKNKVRRYANELMYSDVHAFEVIRVVSSKCVEVRRLEAKIVKSPTQFHAGGFCGHFSDNHDQEWEFNSNEENCIERIRLTKNGWRLGGRRFSMSDSPREFYDFNF